MFITLTVLFSILTILLVVNSRRSNPLPSSWKKFTALSAVISLIGHFLPETTTSWLIAAAIVWLITAIVVIRARFKLRKAKFAMVIMTIILVLLAIYAPKVTTPTDKTPATSATPAKEDVGIIAKAKEILKANGWKDDQYSIGNVDPKIDKSSTGEGAFNPNGVKSPEELIAYLKSGEVGSIELTERIIKDTNAKKEDVLNVSNWVAVQPNTAFDYPGNTGLEKGQVIELGPRNGSSGDIFFLFIPPNSEKSVSVRGACANPQTQIPTPKKPEPPKDPVPPKKKPDPPKDPVPPKLTPKSSNPDDYKKPGDDKERDSGEGTKPKVPIVTTPPEATPPPVEKQKETEVRGGKVIVDTPTTKPGSETGVTAPGATPVVPTTPTTPATSPSPAPTPAPPVNEGGTNNGTVTDD